MFVSIWVRVVTILRSAPPTSAVSATFVRERSQTRRAFVVTDFHVLPHADKITEALVEEGYHVDLIPIAPGEPMKSLETAGHLYDILGTGLADRRTLVVAVGGGVIGDLAGFVAATCNRGLPLLMVPTTLLAMVDSSVGGKVGVNHPRGKNLIGAFHQPVGVWIDTAALDTLPDARISQRPGRGGQVRRHPRRRTSSPTWRSNVEAILRRDPEAVRHIVARSCRLKADVVERDEREETGLRAVLNYGHTFAHAFETVGGYGDLAARRGGGGRHGLRQPAGRAPRPDRPRDDGTAAASCWSDSVCRRPRSAGDSTPARRDAQRQKSGVSPTISWRLKFRSADDMAGSVTCM